MHLTPARIRAGRLDVEYVDVGPRGAATTVLLLHGNFGTWRWWAPSLELLPEGVRALAPTMRGCVGTRGTFGGYAMEVLARDVLGFADAMGVERFHLVGHSLGGAIAVEAALTAPSRVTGLDLVAPAPEDALESIALSEGTRTVMSQFDPSRPLGRAALVGMLRVARDSGASRRHVERILKGLMPGADPMTVDFPRLVSDAANMQPLAIVGVYQALAEWNLADRAEALRMPVRVLAGAKDPLVPVAALDALAASLSGALHVFPGAGHSPMLEAPSAFMAWLEKGLVAPPVEDAQAPASAAGRRPTVWASLGKALGRLWGSGQPPAPVPVPADEV